MSKIDIGQVEDALKSAEARIAELEGQVEELVCVCRFTIKMLSDAAAYHYSGKTQITAGESK